MPCNDFVSFTIGSDEAKPARNSRITLGVQGELPRRKESSFRSLCASSNDDAGLVGGLIAAAVVAIAALCCILAMAKKEKEGKPVFAPVHNPVNERVAEKA